MRISEAIGDSKPLDVKFPGAVLHIEYRPPAYTIAEMEQAEEDKNNPARLVKMIQDLVSAWDLEDDNGEPIDLTDSEAVRTKVIGPIITGIIKAVKEDNLPGEA